MSILLYNMRAQRTITKYLVLNEEEILELDDLYGRVHVFQDLTDKINFTFRLSKLTKKIDINSNYFLTFEPVLNDDNVLKTIVCLFNINNGLFKKHIGFLSGGNRAVKTIIKDSYIGQFVFKHDNTNFILVIKSKDQKNNIFYI